MISQVQQLAGAVSASASVRSSPNRAKADSQLLHACASCLRLCAERLFVHHPAEGRPHAGTLVETKRPGVALGVDAETDAGLAALPEPSERVREKRRADTLPPPGATREKDLDEAAPVGVCGADRPGNDIVPGLDQAPQIRVEPLAQQVGP